MYLRWNIGEHAVKDPIICVLFNVYTGSLQIVQTAKNKRISSSERQAQRASSWVDSAKEAGGQEAFELFDTDGHITLLISRSELENVPEGPKPKLVLTALLIQIVLASMASLKVGFSHDIFIERASDPRNRVLFTERGQMKGRLCILLTSFLSTAFRNLNSWCSEDRIPGSVACSGFDAKVVNKLALERMVIRIASNPIKKHKRTQLQGVFCDVIETGDMCAICQEKMQGPVLLRCKHIFCEDCVSECLVLLHNLIVQLSLYKHVLQMHVFERERTCPLCRAVVKPAELHSFGDGSTSLICQLF
ncbi:RING/U-box superfamily protein [Artemisia annua]|uniref:RING/U-box superfamily protein n=1 Tax=Artemisia annua TaxID=35608 RepID=A0A2U1Q3M7_ARTAN|nr:RING/U-box superfamily protein [Artemisia annua]